MNNNLICEHGQWLIVRPGRGLRHPIRARARTKAIPKYDLCFFFGTRRRRTGTIHEIDSHTVREVYQNEIENRKQKLKVLLDCGG